MKLNISQGMLFAIIAAILSGFSIFYNKLVIVKGVDPLIFNILKNGGVAILLTLVLLTRNKLPTLRKISRNQWLKLIAIACIGGCIPFILYFDALKNVSAINANLLQKTLFIWVALLAMPFLKERLTSLQMIGYTIIAGSNLFIGGFEGFKWSQSELMILVATLFWSVEHIIAKKTLQDTEFTIVSWARMFIGTGLLIMFALVQGKISLIGTVTQTQFLAIAGSIIFLTFYVTSWYKALSLAKASTVTSILILATPITNVLSSVFITHTFQSQLLVNMIGTMFGLIVIHALSKFVQPQKNIETT